MERALNIDESSFFYIIKQKGDIHMSKFTRRKLKLNIKFNKGIVECAKSPELCKDCKEYCELMELFYYPFDNRDLKECFMNDERRR